MFKEIRSYRKAILISSRKYNKQLTKEQQIRADRKFANKTIKRQS